MAYCSFSIKQDDNGLVVAHVPPIGGLIAISLGLLDEADRGMSVDEEGRLVVVGLVFRPVRFDRANRDFGPPQLLICERVA